jgi:hypothetical protein
LLQTLVAPTLAASSRMLLNCAAAVWRWGKGGGLAMEILLLAGTMKKRCVSSNQRGKHRKIRKRDIFSSFFWIFQNQDRVC